MQETHANKLIHSPSNGWTQIGICVDYKVYNKCLSFKEFFTNLVLFTKFDNQI